jgi:hypothetical protein
MRLVTPAVPRLVIDAEIRAAVYPGHAPARWALPLLDALDAIATGWQRVELDEADMASVWLPPHAGEACHGDTMRLGDGPTGATVRAGHDWLAANAAAYASANPSCWGRITCAARGPDSAIVVSPVAVGDRVKPESSTLVVVDGFHRVLGYWMAGRRTCQAYVPVIAERL